MTARAMKLKETLPLGRVICKHYRVSLQDEGSS